MKAFVHTSMAVLATGSVVLLASASLGAASTRPVEAAGCSQLNKMASLFPSAKRVGFSKRDAVKRDRAREPIWPGWCGRRYWWTTYTTRQGYVDVAVSLYATQHDVGAALHEPVYPAFGSVQVNSNGSRVRTSRSSTNMGVVSAYRNLFISSGSIELVPIAAQLRIHRAIESAFRALH